ncbi:serine/threonine-protein kinase [Naumannella halotolerans]|uniref:non-specific serine/threonine protein kinase n=2 Tax=Naumannella halotolerans TaxID=993414 RepID=A0A4R7J8S8_9ACTN|nr:serine/threonine-protein kinase [Naumannella halotolerans]
MTMTPMRDPLVGHVVDGRYEITDRLARGGMATVYLATDTRLARTVAVKMMHEGLGGDGDFVSKFDREARAAAHLSHPNVVSVFDQGLDGMRPYIVMEYVSGGTLRQLMSREGPLEPLRALQLIEPVLAALADAHEAGLIHRDVKPENVLITDRGQLKVADFGLARAISEQTITATQGVLIGTVSYLPPELVLQGRATPRSDVYSSGVMLFEMLTGSKPHTGDTPIQVAWAHVHNDIEAPSRRRDTSWRESRSGIPPYIDELVRAATRREPTQRPANARELLEAVRQARAALNGGVMDDPALTARFRHLGEVDAASATEVVPRQERPDDPTARIDADRPRTGEAQDPAVRSERSRAERNQAEPVAPRPVRSPPSPERHPTRIEPREVARTARPRGRTRPVAAPPSRRPAPTRRSVSEHRRELLERQRRRRIRGIVWLLLLLMLTLAAVAGGWWLVDGRFTAAPPVAGLTQQEATTSVQTAALSPQTVEEFSEDVPAGSVISTDPAAGSKLERDSPMTLVISKGPERFEAPDVVGAELAEAEEQITGDGALKVGKVSEEWHRDEPAGTVLSSDPQPGESLKRDTAIDLTVSKGPEPIQIADFTGKPAAEARDGLTGSGFTVKEGTAHSDSVAEGDVISQDPAGGTGHRGDEVTITRSLGPEEVEVPQVRAKPLDEAKKLLEDAGFKVKTEEGADFLGLDYVASTDPGEGRKAPKGSTITLTLV